MSPDARDWWQRALRALKTTKEWTDEDPDAAASRAYYTAFYAVSALFSLENRSFRKHTEIEAAVRRDLVKTGKWPVELGAAFSWLATLRQTGDYGGGSHVSPEDAKKAAEKAEQIVLAVRSTSREPLEGPEP